VGVHAVARMAREDTRWFVVGVVTLSIVLFLALPVAMLVVVDHLKMKNEFKAERKAEKEQLKSELREIKKLREELKQLKEK
jgi:predicted RND superfamily exporter protein